MIIVNLDVMLAKRKMKVSDLAEQVGITLANISILKNGKAKKIRVFKYKSKDRSNRMTQGHRQPYTKIKITKING